MIKISVIFLSLLLTGCQKEKHGYMILKNVIGLSKNALYKQYGQAVVAHPLDPQVIFYYESSDTNFYNRKLSWLRLEIKDGVVVKQQRGNNVEKLQIVPHKKPKLIQTKWVSELFDHIGSVSV